MKRSSQLIGWVIAMLSGLISLANAQTFSSSYTSTAPKDCRTIGKPSDLDGSTTQVCPGRSGLVVLISEGDLRETVSVGRNREAAAKEPAAEAWFAPFNSTAHTIEWRAVDDKPFAIIQHGRSLRRLIELKPFSAPDRCWFHSVFEKYALQNPGSAAYKGP